MCPHENEKGPHHSRGENPPDTCLRCPKHTSPRTPTARYARWPKFLMPQSHSLTARRKRLEAWCRRRLLRFRWLMDGAGLVAETLCLACDQLTAHVDLGPQIGEVRCHSCGLREELPDYCQRFGWPTPPSREVL